MPGKTLNMRGADVAMGYTPVKVCDFGGTEVNEKLQDPGNIISARQPTITTASLNL